MLPFLETSEMSTSSNSSLSKTMLRDGEVLGMGEKDVETSSGIGDGEGVSEEGRIVSREKSMMVSRDLDSASSENASSVLIEAKSAERFRWGKKSERLCVRCIGFSATFNSLDLESGGRKISFRRSKVMSDDDGKSVARTLLRVALMDGRKNREMESILAANRTGMEDVVHRMISWQSTHVLLNNSVYFLNRGRRVGRTDIESMVNPLASYILSLHSIVYKKELLPNDNFCNYAVDDALVTCT